MIKVEFNYDPSDDVLYLYNKNNESHYSVDFSDEMIADIDAKGKISGLEIFGASKEFDVPKNSLKEIKSAELSNLSKNGAIIGVGFVLILAKQIIKNKVLVPAVSRSRL